MKVLYFFKLFKELSLSKEFYILKIFELLQLSKKFEKVIFARNVRERGCAGARTREATIGANARGDYRRAGARRL